jgi:hypothetical protein
MSRLKFSALVAALNAVAVILVACSTPIEPFSSEAEMEVAATTPTDSALSVTRQPTQDGVKDAQLLLEDFIHYVFIARPDLANASVEALVTLNMTDVDLAILVDQRLGRQFRHRLDAALQRASRVPELRSHSAELKKWLDRGRAELADQAG